MEFGSGVQDAEAPVNGGLSPVSLPIHSTNLAAERTLQKPRPDTSHPLPTNPERRNQPLQIQRTQQTHQWTCSPSGSLGTDTHIPPITLPTRAPTSILTPPATAMAASARSIPSATPPPTEVPTSAPTQQTIQSGSTWRTTTVAPEQRHYPYN